MRILVVEDDMMLGEAIQSFLEKQGYTVDLVKSGEKALNIIEVIDFSLILLDLCLPNLSGESVLKTIRLNGNRVPVLIVSAKSSTAECVNGLELGADDYIYKPFDLSILLARVRALIRRSTGAVGDDVSVGNVTLSLVRRETLVNGVPIDLTPNEFSILHYLILNAGKVLSKERILSNMHGWDKAAGTNLIEVHIHNLRKKLPDNMIKNIRGAGYTIQ
ncbi:response regulator transcription factor [Vibrio sp. S4M6]|uniref:response regulator transcription factor n=1 Tax=Vibrio sinus TaxID=2946865 RepID=UPI00202A2549|nr:response regulator transcription factor [Vibrio sinus]MCL9780684.1 response regulator transcription factor [Vibrio sinus]